MKSIVGWVERNQSVIVENKERGTVNSTWSQPADSDVDKLHIVPGGIAIRTITSLFTETMQTDDGINPGEFFCGKNSVKFGLWKRLGWEDRDVRIFAHVPFVSKNRGG